MTDKKQEAFLSLWKSDLWAVTELCSVFWEGAARFASPKAEIKWQNTVLGSHISEATYDSHTPLGSNSHGRRGRLPCKEGQLISRQSHKWPHTPLEGWSQLWFSILGQVEEADDLKQSQDHQCQFLIVLCPGCVQAGRRVSDLPFFFLFEIRSPPVTQADLELSRHQTWATCNWV